MNKLPLLVILCVSLTPLSAQAQRRSSGANVITYTIQDIRQWPVFEKDSPSYDDARNILVDPKVLEELRKQYALGEGGLAPRPTVDPREIAIAKQGLAWKEFVKIARLSEVLKGKKDAIVSFVVKNIPDPFSIKLGEPKQIPLVKKNIQAGETYTPIPDEGVLALQSITLESITLRLVKVASNALFFRVDEVNGESFFDSHKPIWAYRYGPGLK